MLDFEGILEVICRELQHPQQVATQLLLTVKTSNEVFNYKRNQHKADCSTVKQFLWLRNPFRCYDSGHNPDLMLGWHG